MVKRCVCGGGGGKRTAASLRSCDQPDVSPMSCRLSCLGCRCVRLTELPNPGVPWGGNLGSPEILAGVKAGSLACTWREGETD